MILSGSQFQLEWKKLLVTHAGFWIYLVGGAFFYFLIESPSYRKSTITSFKVNVTLCEELLDSIEGYLSDIAKVPVNGSSISQFWVAVVNESCGNLTSNYQQESASATRASPWEFSSALFLCMTVLTTIGYGTYSPRSAGGKVFCILYGVVGIPIFGLFLATTSEYFSNNFLIFYEKNKKLQEKEHGILIASILYLIPGLAVFVFIPAVLFMFLEDWDYLDSLYYTYVTLTTIGFGDVEAAQQPTALLWLYRICWVIWVFLGMAYWAIIFNFTTKALKSKHLRQRWIKTSQAIAQQASEMRKLVEQLSAKGTGSQRGLAGSLRGFGSLRKPGSVRSTNGSLKVPPHPRRKGFVAHKSRSAIDFAFRLTESMGNLKNDIDSQSRSKALVTFSQEESLDEMIMELSSGFFGEQLPMDTSSDQLGSNEETSNAENQRIRELIDDISPEDPSQLTHHSNTFSIDSGLEQEVVHTMEAVIEKQAESFEIARRMSTLSRTNSCGTLPTGFQLSRRPMASSPQSSSEDVEKAGVIVRQMGWKIWPLRRSNTQPTIERHSLVASQRLSRQDLMEGVVIVQEALYLLYLAVYLRVMNVFVSRKKKVKN